MKRCWILVALTLALAGCPGQEPATAPVDPPAPPPSDAPADPPPTPAAEEPLSTGKGATSPQDCFRRMARAYKSGDWLEYHDLLTTESAIGTLPVLSFLCGAVCGAEKPLQQQLEALLARHGLTGEERAPAGGEGGMQGMLALYEPVKDKRQLFADLYTFIMDHKDRVGGIEEAVGLEDVKIEGDIAVGQMISRAPDGQEDRRPAEFRKVDGRWYAHLELQ